MVLKKQVCALLALAILLSFFAGCESTPAPAGSGGEGTADGAASETGGETSEAPVDGGVFQDEELFTERDRSPEYDESQAVTVRLDGTTAEASSDSVRIAGGTVTLTEQAVYVVSGTLGDGMLVVDADEEAKIQIVLNGATIVGKSSPALYVREADKVFLTLEAGTENTLENGGSFSAIDENNLDGALFSRQDLTLNGSGSLTVISPAAHGIVCKDDLVLAGGTYTVCSAAHGLHVNDSVRISKESRLCIDAGKDGIHCENTEDAASGFVYLSGGDVDIEAEGDGICASSYLQIDGGTLHLLVGGGATNGTKQTSEGYGSFGGFGGRPGAMHPGGRMSDTADTEEDATSMKGLKAVAGLWVSDGSITVDSADDALHSDSSLTVSGGTLVLASGDDALHAEDTLTVTGGTIDVSACYEGLEALHIDVQGGDIKLKASDDGLNAAGGTDQSGTEGGRDGMFGGGMGGGRPGGGMSSNSNGSIKISGGTLEIVASGDGLDANGSLSITGGHVTVQGPAQGDTATLDYDTSAVITGGTFLGTGAAGMAQTFSGSEQGVIAVSVGSQRAGTAIVLTDEAGDVVLEHTPSLDFAVVIFSSPALESGARYTVTAGSVSGEVTAS